MNFRKLLLNLFKYLLLGIGVFIAWAYIDDRLWHPLKKEGLEFDIFGGNVNDIKIISRVDFIGVDLHGGYFDFYEYEINNKQIEILINQNRLKEFPLFSNKVFNQNKNTIIVGIKKWTKTPPDDLEENNIFNILEFGNFNDYKASKRFIDSEYLKQKGNYFSYYNGYPHGLYIYVLVPKEKRLFIIRNR